MNRPTEEEEQRKVRRGSHGSKAKEAEGQRKDRKKPQPKAAQEATSAGAGPADARPTVRERLRELKSLLDEELLPLAVYEERARQIASEL